MIPAGLLLVPGEGDPHGLLAEGPCGAAPPTASKCPGCGWCGGRLLADEDGCCLGCGADMCFDEDGEPIELPQALVIGWNHEEVLAGCLWARGIVSPDLWPTVGWVRRVLLGGARSARTFEQFSAAAAAEGCRLIAVDAEGREMEP